MLVCGNRYQGEVRSSSCGSFNFFPQSSGLLSLFLDFLQEFAASSRMCLKRRYSSGKGENFAKIGSDAHVEMALSN